MIEIKSKIYSGLNLHLQMLKSTIIHLWLPTKSLSIFTDLWLLAKRNSSEFSVRHFTVLVLAMQCVHLHILHIKELYYQIFPPISHKPERFETKKDQATYPGSFVLP